MRSYCLTISIPFVQEPRLSDRIASTRSELRGETPQHLGSDGGLHPFCQVLGDVFRLPVVDADRLCVPAVVRQDDARRRTVLVSDHILSKRVCVLLDEVAHVRVVGQFSLAHLEVDVREHDVFKLVLGLLHAAATAVLDEAYVVSVGTVRR